MASEAIRRIVHVFDVKGEEKVVSAHQRAASATENHGKAALSLDKQFSGLERRYNTVIRAQQDYERVQRQVNAAVAQNPALQQRANDLLAIAAQRYRSLTADNDNFAKAQARAVAGITAFATSLRGLALGGAIGTGIGILSGLLSGSTFIENTIEAENALQKLRAVMDATGNAAGVTEQGMLDLAASIQQTTRFGDEAVTSATALLLSLSSIGGEQVPRAVRALTDMATILGVDLNQAAVTLSKALEGNVSALQRYGVRVDSDMIAKLKAAGEETKAFDIVLGKLENRFGGAAVAARQTLGGAIDALKNSFGDLFELGSQSKPLVDAIENLTKILQDESTKQAVLKIGEAFVTAFTRAVELVRETIQLLENLKNFDFAAIFSQFSEVAKFLASPATYVGKKIYEGITKPKAPDISGLGDLSAFGDAPSTTNRIAVNKVLEEQAALYKKVSDAIQEETAALRQSEQAKDTEKRLKEAGTNANTEYGKSIVAQVANYHAEKTAVDAEKQALRDAESARKSAATAAAHEAEFTRKAEEERKTAIESLELEIKTLFMNSEAVKAAVLAHQELAKYRERGITVTPELEAQVKAYAKQAAAIEKEIEGLKKLKSTIQEVKDAGIDFASQFVSGILDGKKVMDSLAEAAINVGKKLRDKGLQDALIGLASGNLVACAVVGVQVLKLGAKKPIIANDNTRKEIDDRNQRDRACLTASRLLPTLWHTRRMD